MANVTDVLSALQSSNTILSKIQQTLSGGLPSISVPVSVANGGTGAAAAGNVLLQNLGVAPFLRGYLAGLAVSSVTNTTIPTTAGVATDDTNTALLSLGTTTLNLAVTGLNGLDTGALANTTWYHAFIISQAAGASPGLLASTSATSPSFPVGYTLKRRIYSFLTDGAAHVVAMHQVADTFTWDTNVTDVNAVAPGAAAVTRTLTVPRDVAVEAIFNLGMVCPTVSATEAILITPLSATDQAAATPFATISLASAVNNEQISTQARCLTNTSAQVRSRMLSGAAGSAIAIITIGWRDFLGLYT